jgi:EAL domain-containing protein (putative c-di-GMP-specific phosphodiesterase class I)
MIPIGNWVVEQACSCAAGWADPSMFLTVNASGMELRDSGFVDTARRSLQMNGLRPDRLVIDVTEASLLDDADDASQTMQQLRAAGIRTALDDFGTGFSSLSSIRRLPFDMIKIDAEIVQSIEDSRSNAVAATIINMARNLGLQTVAEGVETSEQAAALRSLGCDLAQGYFFYKPLSTVAMTAVVEQQPTAVRPSALHHARQSAAIPSFPPPLHSRAHASSLPSSLPPPTPDAARSRPVEMLNDRPEIGHLLRPLLS